MLDRPSRRRVAAPDRRFAGDPHTPAALRLGELAASAARLRAPALRLLPLLVVLLAIRPAAAAAQSPVLEPREVAIGAGAVITVFLLDEAARGAYADWPSGELAIPSRFGNMFGRPQVVLPLVGGAYALGLVNGDRALRDAAAHAAIGLAASGVANGALKFGVGRLRPSTRNDARRFRPMNADDGWQSFPSGHTVVAFSLATAVSMEARTAWVAGVSYGMASVVAWSRLYSDRHWPSDVVGGAVVGTLTTRAVLRALHRHDATGAPPRIQVLAGPGALGLSVPLP